MIGTTVGRYQIVEKLGAGAFGEVYRAVDPLLGRNVALKSLPLDMAEDIEEIRRLLKEAIVLARMEHPHIAGIHDLVEDAQGRTYIVMQHVDGETLENRLKRGPLSPAETVRIGRQLASALDYAHAAGVLHRDIKPANICLTPGGSAKLLDFGLARVFEPPAEPGGTGASRSGPASGLGSFVGTPAYMPPELYGGFSSSALGDIYSLGVTLFEMLTGTRPFPAVDFPTLHDQITLKPVPRLDERVPGLHKSLSAAVTRAMSRNPAERFRTAAELERALAETALVSPPADIKAKRTPRGAYAVVALVLIIAAVLGASKWIHDHFLVQPPPVLAVLPFTLISADSTEKFRADGLATAIAGRLGALALSVVPPKLTASRPDEDASPEAGMRKTGSNYALAGALTHDGTRLTVNLHLFRRGARASFWARTIEGTPEKDFELEARAARDVEQALSQHKILLRPTPEKIQSQLGTAATQEPRAYAAYTRALALLDDYNQSDNLDRAIALFQTAIREDSLFDAAFAGLGQAYLWKYDVTQDTTWVAAADRALQSAERRSVQDAAVLLTRAELASRRGRHEEARAILVLLTKLTPESDRPWASLGASYWKDSNWKDAEAEYREAIARRPEYWEYHNELGRALYRQNRYDDAINAYEAVYRFRPDSPLGYANMAAAYKAKGDTTLAGRYARMSVAIAPSIGAYTALGNLAFDRNNFAEAAFYFRRVTELAPGEPVVWRNLGDVQLAGADASGARQSYERVITLCTTLLVLDSRNLQRLRLRAICQAKNGRYEPARKDIAQALALAPTDGAMLYTSCVVETLAGNLDRALELLGAALQHGMPAQDARNDPDLARLRQMAAFSGVVSGA